MALGENGMTRGKASGITLWKDDARVVLGMVARGDRDHDIAAWFGVNQGRIAEVKAGEFGELIAASTDQLPPSGPPGIKGRRLRAALENIREMAAAGDAGAATAAITEAMKQYDANEG
jgi:hypothetical protein